MNITVGQIIAAVGVLASFVGSVGVIVGIVVKHYNKLIKKTIMDPINTNIENVKKELSAEIADVKNEMRTSNIEIDASECKNFLVRFLGDIERGTDIDPVEIERAFEIMGHYTDDLKRNSYIHARWEAVMGKKTLVAAIKAYSKK